MKKMLIVMLLVVSMLTMVGFAPAETSYWEDMKAIYEWDGLEGEAEMQLKVVIPPDVDLHYNVEMYSVSNLKDFVSYMEIVVEDVEGLQEIPTIKLYTVGTDFYINTDAVLPLLSVMGLEETVDIQEEYILFRNTEAPIDMNSKMLQDIIQFIEEMDLGIDLGMTKEGNTYTLKLDSDKMIDLLEAYMLYVITNIDKLPAELMPAEMPELTEEDLQEVLELYDTFIAPNIPMAKAFITGSYYQQVTTFEEDAVTEETELALITPMAQIQVEGLTVSRKLTTTDIQLPESVLVFTQEDLEAFIMSQFAVETQVGFKAIVDLEGSYVKPAEGTFEQGTVQLKVEDGRSFIAVADASQLLDIQLEGEGFIPVKDLEDYGFYVIWNSDIDAIEIY
ncbi:hypothetical protein SAMN05660297_00568 [Natronincola peptidivorans]|uniref:Copper amine oxidase N-terminal domain-containing protein n=1 Tax=Natronincola peptidivorans TaxID=426128 RepID=A0A1H9ZKT8_9FIRM|nr:hypothetical protein [Natronincola peptidivorans]SES81411.1 hypothetical protein SAMN05660297_00568 [Natronincola peptidivorans]